MKHGFVKIAAVSCPIKVADCKYNTDSIIRYMNEASSAEVQLAVFPELCITGSSCGDLFRQTALINSAYEGLARITENSANKDTVFAIGSPLLVNNKLYNCTVFVQKGKILAAVPKSNLNHTQTRVFSPAPDENFTVDILGQTVPFGTNTILSCKSLPSFTIAADLGEDLYLPVAPSVYNCLSGATVVVNSSAMAELADSRETMVDAISAHTKRNICTYVYANAGEGESTTDNVYSGRCIICEKGKILNMNDSFTTGITISETDTQLLTIERQRSGFNNHQFDYQSYVVEFDLPVKEIKLSRKYPQNPFVPENNADKRFEHILNIQANGLKKRIVHTTCQKLIIGISGGLDSCLALLVALRTLQILNRPSTDILAVTMPCFGTTTRTKSNAEKLCELYGVDFQCIDIAKSVEQHFEDIGHDSDNYNVVFENAQARERTQILMDLANKYNGMVIGTGDLSELVLGWATYSGDHMSMYGVNADVPKTLVRHLVRHIAENCGNEEIKSVLLDILDTPVSPELLPADGDSIAQKTEDLVGPYELHDFFLYYAIRYGFEPKKIYKICKNALGDVYDEETIYKWLKNFYRRFFAQQFKRSCLPDGPKVGSVGISPRGDLVMPSDAVNNSWIENL